MSKFPETLRILLIEDDPEDVTLFEYMVRNMPSIKAQTDYALGLKEAISALKQKSFDVVFLDLVLPDTRMFETFERLRPYTLNTPVIVLTGCDDEEVAVESLRRGAEDFLVKGKYDEGALLRSIRHAIERHRIKKELAKVSQELTAVNMRLERLAILDPLTNVLNRRGLEQVLFRELDFLKRDETGLLTIVVGLDNFKRINDGLGHRSGDIVLKEIADRVRQALRTTDYVARIGGDQFIILLPQTRFAEGVRVAEKVRLTISKGSVSVNSGKEVHVTASIGLGAVSHDTLSLDQFLLKAHLLLYQSKRQSRGRLALGEEWQHTQIETAEKELEDIYTALKCQDRYRVLKQPIYDLDADEIMGYEFLSRSSVTGFEMPDDFFRFSMEADILSLVDRNCFRTCVVESQNLGSREHCHLNLFPSTLIETPVEVLLDMMAASSQLNENYCIEISEQQIIGDPSYLAQTVEALRKGGIQIAMDDVGFGRSCLESLVLLEPDVVKIDKKWVMGISKDDHRKKSLERLLKVTRALGSDVVAEGIETTKDLAVLKSLGVHYGQGYLFGVPA